MSAPVDKAFLARSKHLLFSADKNKQQICRLAVCLIYDNKSSVYKKKAIAANGPKNYTFVWLGVGYVAKRKTRIPVSRRWVRLNVGLAVILAGRLGKTSKYNRAIYKNVIQPHPPNNFVDFLVRVLASPSTHERGAREPRNYRDGKQNDAAEN